MEASASNSNASRNDWQRLRSYFAQFAGPHQAVVESTGFWYWLADLLDELGVGEGPIGSIIDDCRMIGHAQRGKSDKFVG